jgi:two-component system sensor histidine kinase/response regulator
MADADMNRAPPARLLICDDESELVRALCEILAAQGYSTTGACSGQQAIDALRAVAASETTQFDVLITDLMMPVIDGISLLRAAQDIDNNLVSVVMSGHGTIDTAVAAMKAGALDYILKPFNLRVAMPVLSRALAVRRLRLDNAALHQQVANRTVELESANRDLRSANRELDAFAHSVSHDLRQPLSVMIGFAELLIGEKPGPLNSKQKEFLGDIRTSGTRLLRLTGELLQFSRLGQQALKKQVVNMTVLVGDILHTMQAAEPHRNIDLRVGALPDVSADPSLLRLVLTNLLSNAFKFTHHISNPTIEVTGQLRPGEATYCVRDNGAGFNMADAHRLFSMFQRLHHDGEFEGSGVGLSIVQRILERHGGTISAEGQAGQGAAFTFTLPSDRSAAGCDERLQPVQDLVIE